MYGSEITAVLFCDRMCVVHDILVLPIPSFEIKKKHSPVYDIQTRTSYKDKLVS